MFTANGIIVTPPHRKDDFMKPTKKLPLFCVTGASCVGKTTVCNELFKNEKDYIVLEGDIFWNDVYNTPEDDYRDYRSRWMKLAAYISQIGTMIRVIIWKQWKTAQTRECGLLKLGV